MLNLEQKKRYLETQIKGTTPVFISLNSPEIKLPRRGFNTFCDGRNHRGTATFV